MGSDSDNRKTFVRPVFKFDLEHGDQLSNPLNTPGFKAAMIAQELIRQSEHQAEAAFAVLIAASRELERLNGSDCAVLSLRTQAELLSAEKAETQGPRLQSVE